MEGQDAMVPLAPPAGNGGQAKKRRNRNRNRNRNAKSKSRSPTREEQAERGPSADSNEDSEWHLSERKKNKSRSPTRRNNANKSKSPTRRQGNKSRSPNRSNQHRRHKAKLVPPSDMTVICNRCDLWDSAAHFQPDDSLHSHHHCNYIVRPYHFAPGLNRMQPGAANAPAEFTGSTAIARIPHHFEKSNLPVQNFTEGQGHCDVIDTSMPNPHDPNVVHDKYWAQRRRLFSKFDQGIQLDGQGWYSVTPEIIADHVAERVSELATTHVIPHESSQGIVILDAFCGCGGNSIAFGKIPAHIISKVVCVDTDRTKLIKAAHNAAIYGIPREKLVFVECNSVFILKHCYKNGQFILDQPTAEMPPYMPPPVLPFVKSGYHIGGLDMLPRRIDAVFMDPPWGGVDYEVLGKNGYDLQKNMKIQFGPPPAPEEDYEADGDGCDDFFDSFAAPAPKPKSKISQKARKANFNKQAEGSHVVDGMELLRAAAEATSAHVVVYDLPRNTNKTSLAKCAMGAGYRGNLKLEEHYLNGRLKTVTAYMGVDYSTMINSLHEGAHSAASGDEA